jgi:hypothetical protein
MRGVRHAGDGDDERARAARMLQALLAAADPAGLLEGGAGVGAYDACLGEAADLLLAAPDGDILAASFLRVITEGCGAPADAEAVRRLAAAAAGWARRAPVS